MRLSVRHASRYLYTPAVQRASLRVRLFPSRFATQTIMRWTVTINGAEQPPLYAGQYGDNEAIWTSAEALEAIDVIAEGVVETSDAAGVVRGRNEPARPGIFMRATKLTAPSGSIALLAEAGDGLDPLEGLHRLRDRVRDAVDYIPRSTDTRTSATEALKRGRGVCQDHAHIFVAAARLRGVPARYVAGYLLAEGEEETHAWGEAYVPDLGWVGFDPTNRQCPTDAYVRLCTGLDATDAAPIRGCVDHAEHEQLVVSVDIAAAAQQQQ